MKKLLFLAIIFSLFLFSCDLLDTTKELAGNFWAMDLTTNKPYRIDAEKLYTGKYCEIWAEIGSGVTYKDAQTLADEYDTNIYTKMINAFSSQITYRGINFSNTMDFADWVGDGDGKLCILMLDIKDNYKAGVNESYVAGYFYTGDLMVNYYSNKRDMIYIDTEPGFSTANSKKEAYKTLAHEMQHLMNFATSNVYRTRSMDTWIDEGLSSAAEYVYSGQYSTGPTGRITWFMADPTNLIRKGNNFFVWGNREGTGAGSYKNSVVLDDYATVYLFFQWLRLQSGGTDIYKNIITSTYSDYRAVTTYAANINASYGTWDTLLETWLAANYINAPSGAYGYMNDSDLNKIKAPSAPSGITSLPLYPGEAVYSGNVQTQPSGQGDNIRNAYLSATLSDTYTQGSTLLTYNKNTIKFTNIFNGTESGSAETGVTTGVAASISTMRSAYSENEPVISGPFRIDAGDLLRMNGHGGFNDRD